MKLVKEKFCSARCRKILLSLFVSLLGLSISHAQLASFPGAEGTGAYAVGGRFGDVYHVTTLSSSATTPGSFYYGIANAPTAGRTIVFDVSGYIHIGSTYNMGKSKITIAGQTAPGDGIGFKDGTFNIVGNDVIIRDIRFRDGNSADSVDLDGDSNIVMDHCDVMFSNDENLSSFSTPPDLFTFQWCMNSWGMETHSCGGLWDQNRATCHHSLWSHNHTRNPKVRSSLLDWVNNVTFDWDIGFIMGDSSSGANWNANVRGCYFVSPPGNTHGAALEKANLDSHGNPNFHLYIDDSAMDGDGDGVLSVSKTGYALASGSYGVSATPFATAGIPVTIDDHLTAYKKVLSAVGPVRMDSDPAMSLRDELNTLAVNNVVQQRRFHVNAPSKTGVSGGGFGTLNSLPPVVDTDQDGMPDFWESTLGSNPNLDDHTNAVSAGAFVPTGYTRLEEYLQYLMMPHTAMAKSTAAVPNALDVDLHKYTLGFTNRLPVTYTISNVTNGTVTLTNGYLAHFVPTLNYSGRARFDFTVTDGDGSTWTQTFAVLVSAISLPRDLVWKGDGTVNNFDTNALNFIFGTNLTTFAVVDNVTFDDTGSATPAINFTNTYTPASVTVAADQNYTFNGSGAIAGPASLTKSGAGTLTVANNNTFTGPVTINSGSIVLKNGGFIGSGAITFQSGTLTYNPSSDVSSGINNAFVVPAGQTATINFGNRFALSGNVTGSGMLNLNCQTGVNRDDFKGSASAFTGTVNILGTGGIRMFVNGGAFSGFDNALTTFNSPVWMYFYDNSGGNTFYFGALSGTNTSSVIGYTANGGAATLQLGALNLDTTYAGQFQSTLNLVKNGTGTFTVSGNSAHTGSTTVSNGTLLVTGNFSNSLVTVVNGGTLRGTGFLGGGASIQSGGKLLPGLGDGQPGTLTTSNTLTLATPNLYFDLSSSPAGANDKIVMQGGSLALSGVQNYIFYLTSYALGAGTYGLIEGATGSSASGVSFVSNLPGNTRQTINLYRASAGANPSYVRLDVTGSAAALTWSGTNGTAWDVSTTTNWLNAAAVDKFFNLDTVRFDDNSTNGNVIIAGKVQPAAVLVTNNSLNYTIGTGELGGIAKLTKSGAGMLILNSSNSFTGGTLVNGGTLQFVNNFFAGGVGPITLNGGTLYLNGIGTGTTISAIGTNTLQTSGQPYSGFNLQGSGVLNFNIGGGGVFSPGGNWNGFSGTINFLTGNWIRELDTTSFGSSNAVWNFGSNGGLYNKYGGATISLGAVFGGTGSGLSGATTAYASTTTFVIGGVNTNSVFSGVISDGGAANTALIFNGPGSLSLSGTNSYTGNTLVNGGTLRVNNTAGSGTGAGDVQIASGATLAGNGSISGLVSIADGATLAPGNSAGTLTIGDGLVLGDGSILNFELGTVSDSVNVTGDLTFSGTLNITNLAGFGVGAYTLFNYGGQLSLGHLTFGAKPAGYNYSINTDTAGQVKLIVAPTAPPNFGKLTVSGTKLSFSGTNGIPLGKYYLLSSTNVNLPLASWICVATNLFDTNGGFNFTNGINQNASQSFYRLQLP